MGWNSTTQRLCKSGGCTKIAANGQGDLQRALNSSLMSQIRLFTEPEIAKYAKWHPYRSTALFLTEDWQRREAGRASVDDYSLQYGVRAYGVGSNITLDKIHDCRFEYEQPTAEQVAQGRTHLRVYDFFHPTDNSLGYRANANTLDLSGTIYPSEGSLSIVKDQQTAGGIEVWITYTEYTAAQREEYISIKDFLTNGVLEYDPLDCYPCVLISVGDAHYVRALFPANGSSTTPTKLTTGTTTWRIDTRDCPAAWRDDDSVKVSVFLTNEIHLLPETSIADWNEMGTGDIWAAWFCPVPDACGRAGQIGAIPTTLHAMPSNAIYQGTAFNFVTLVFSAAGSGSDASFTWTADIRNSNSSLIASLSGSGTMSEGMDTPVFTRMADWGLITALDAGTYTISVAATCNGITKVQNFTIVVS